MNVIINIKKEKGWTSQDVCSKLRGILHTKKIGHTGTLDPNATGVLPVCIGKATKLCSLITDWSKEYEAQWILGKTSDSYDITGNIIKCSSLKVGEKDIRDITKKYEGVLSQIPPMYSARKVNGKKLYEYARAGESVQRKAKEVTVYSIDINKIELPEIILNIHCSKGTYIRSLCHDMGEELGCGGLMGDLKRTKVGPFKYDEAYTIEEVEEYVQKGNLNKIVKTIDSIFEELPRAVISREASKGAYNGNCLEFPDINAEEIRVYDGDNKFLGIYKNDKAMNIFKPKIFVYEKE